MTVLFCPGPEVYSECDFPAYSVELSEKMNCTDNFVSLDSDAFDDDHMSQTFQTFWIAERLYCLPIPNNPFLGQIFSFSNWQPPQKSFFRT
jgi:hypothetical protein